MNSPSRFRLILDAVEARARGTDALLYKNSRDFWEDIAKAWKHREENKNFWMFCVRWMRGELVRSMERSSARELFDILAALKPEDLLSSGLAYGSCEELKRRIVAHLLPIMVLEVVIRIRNAATDHVRKSHRKFPSRQSRDQRG